MGAPFNILIIDDNPADAALLEMAWKECKVVQTRTAVLHESSLAIRFIRGGAEPNPAGFWPDLVMLDYKMPIDGGVALSEVKGDPDFDHIPVIVISGSHDPLDYVHAYRRGANCCFQKPHRLEEHLKLVCEIAEHWLVKAVVPRLSPEAGWRI